MLTEPHRVIQKLDVMVIDTLWIHMPYSHSLPSRKDALEWIAARGLTRECRVISESLYKQHGGK